MYWCTKFHLPRHLASNYAWAGGRLCLLRRNNKAAILLLLFLLLERRKKSAIAFNDELSAFSLGAWRGSAVVSCAAEKRNKEMGQKGHKVGESLFKAAVKQGNSPTQA